MKPNDLLFVYGTLRKGGRLHHFLDGCEFQQAGTITGTMFSLGYCPAITLHGEHTIHGELYRLGNREQINSINRLEAGYDCEQVDVDGNPAWVFHMSSKDLDQLPVIEDGDWLQYAKDQE